MRLKLITSVGGITLEDLRIAIIAEISLALKKIGFEYDMWYVLM